MADGFKIATAYVTVTPDTDGFAEKLQAGLDAEDTKAKVKADADTESGVEAGRKLGEDAQAGADEKPVKVKADSAGAKKEGDGAGGFMVAGITEAVVAGGPLVGAALAGVGIVGLAALGVELQKDNPAIQAGWKQLSTDAQSAGKEASQGLVQPISAALTTLDQLVLAEKPIFNDMFESVAGDIPDVVDGVQELVQNALPGLDNMLENSEPIARGFSNVLSGIGSAVDTIGNSVASNSGHIGEDLTDVQAIIQTLGQGIGNLIGITSKLAEGALPALDGGLQEVSSILGGLNSALGPALPAIGGLGTAAEGAYLTFSKLGNAGNSLSGWLSGKGGVLGSLSFLGDSVPVVGAAVTGLSLVTGILSAQANSAAVALDNQAKSSQNLNTAIGQQTDITQQMIDQDVISNASKLSVFSEVGTTLSATLQQAGVSQQAFASAVEQGGPALDGVQNQLYGYVIAQQKAYDAGQNVTTAELAAGQGANTLAGQLGNLHQAFDASSASAAEQALSTAALLENTQQVTPQVNQLSTDMQTLSSATATTSAKVSSLQDALAQLANNGAEPANDALAQAWNTVNTLGNTLSGTTGKLLDANGQLDLTTTKGEAVNTAIENLRNTTAQYAQSLIAQGDNAGDATQAAQNLTNQLVGPLAKALGLSTSQVQGLLNQYDDTRAAFNQALNVNVNTAPAAGAIDHLVQTENGRTITLQVNTSGAVSTIQMGHATGGIDIPTAKLPALAMASGGTIPALSGSVATAVAPNTPRVIGDNSQVAESFIPWDGSARSRGIWEQTGQANGWRSSSAVAGLQSVVNQISVATADPSAAVAMLVSELQWTAMLGAK